MLRYRRINVFLQLVLTSTFLSSINGVSNNPTNLISPNPLSGRQIVLGTIKRTPYIVIEYDGGKIKQVTGLIPSVIEWMARKYNFTYQYIEPSDSSYGAFVNGSWNGLVGMAIRGDVDLVTAYLSITYQRSLYIDFTTPLMNDPLSIMIPFPQKDSKISGIIKPFETKVWLGIGASLLSAAIVLSYITKFEYQMGLERRSNHFKHIQNFISQSWVLFRILTNANDVLSFTLATKILVALWCLIAVVLINCYTGILFSYLTAPKLVPVINTVQDLAESNVIQLAVMKYTSIETFILTAPNGSLLSKIGDKIRANPQNTILSWNNSYDAVAYGGKAYVAGKTVMKISINDDFIKTKQCRLTMAKETMADDRIALAFPKMSPFTQIFNQEINWLRQVGLLYRWEMAYSPKPNRCTAELSSSGVKSSEKSLGLSYFSSPLTLLIAGYSSSVLAFFSRYCMRKLLTSKDFKKTVWAPLMVVGYFRNVSYLKKG